MNKLALLVSLFRKGEAVTDPATLHDKDKLVIAVSAFIVALGQGVTQLFGLDLSWFTPELANMAAGGVVVVYLGVQHFISSPKRGLLPPKGEPDAGPPDPGSRA